MTEKPLPSVEQIVSNAINLMMDKCENNAIMRIVFEKKFVEEGYELDWNKRLVNYIKNLKAANYRKSGFLHSPVLTSNTYPIIQGIELNNIIINYCEEKLKEIKEEDLND